MVEGLVAWQMPQGSRSNRTNLNALDRGGLAMFSATITVAVAVTLRSASSWLRRHRSGGFRRIGDELFQPRTLR